MSNSRASWFNFTAGYPGQGKMIAGPFDLRAAGYVPWDRIFATCAMVVTLCFIVYRIAAPVRRWMQARGSAIVIPASPRLDI